MRRISCGSILRIGILIAAAWTTTFMGSMSSASLAFAASAANPAMAVLRWGPHTFPAVDASGDVWYTVNLGPKTYWPLLAVGASRDAVRTLQVDVAQTGVSDIPVDGVFGDQTRSAVVRFQKVHKLSASGAVDGPTWSVMQRSLSLQKQRTLRRGDKGTAVKAL